MAAEKFTREAVLRAVLTKPEYTLAEATKVVKAFFEKE